MLLAYMYGLSHIFPKKKYLQACLYLQLLSLFALSTFVYYQTESPKDNFYLLKAQAGEVLAQMHS